MAVSPSSDSRSAIDIANMIERARGPWTARRVDEAEMLCRQALAVWPGHSPANLSHINRAFAQARGAFATAARGAGRLIGTDPGGRANGRAWTLSKSAIIDRAAQVRYPRGRIGHERV
jgi:hypothetical protein